jgi:hypothetical protein
VDWIHLAQDRDWWTFGFHLKVENFFEQMRDCMLSGSLVITAWHVLRLWMEETASRYGG